MQRARQPALGQRRGAMSTTRAGGKERSFFNSFYSALCLLVVGLVVGLVISVAIIGPNNGGPFPFLVRGGGGGGSSSTAGVAAAAGLVSPRTGRISI